MRSSFNDVGAKAPLLPSRHSARAHPEALAEPSRSRFAIGSLLWRLVLFAILFLTFLPFIFMVMTSLKTTQQFYRQFWLPSWPLHFENYSKALADLAPLILNSLFITAVSITGIVVMGVIAGFIFARFKFPGSGLLYYSFLAMMMIPGSLTLIPSFMLVKQLGMLDTYQVMILPYIAGGQVMSIYLLRGFFAEMENDLFEAAQVDGAGLLRQLWHVGVPMATPIVGVVAIVSAIGVWNNYLWPLVTTSSESVMVLTVGIQRYMGRVGGLYGQMYAGYTISMLPLAVLFSFCTKLFLRGLTAGALKA